MANRQADLAELLHLLRLPTIAEVFGDWALRAGKDKLTHEAFLYQLVMAELDGRTQRRTERMRRASGLPEEKTFKTIKLSRFDPTIRTQIERLKTGTFLEDATNVVAVILDLMNVESYRAEAASQRKGRTGELNSQPLEAA
jgi:hypothetical protein